MTGKKIHVFLVDDEIDLLELNKMSLEIGDFVVTTCHSPVAAKQLILDNSFDVIVSDFRMPEMTGLDLFEWVKANKPTPFCIMTGFSTISSSESAKELGLDGFLSKPFRRNELIEMVNEAYKNNQSKDQVDPKEEFSKIPIRTFISGKEVPYRVYVQLGKGKFVKIAHSGESLDEQRLIKYRNDGIEYLYLKRDDFKKFIHFHGSLHKATLANPAVSPAQKSDLLNSLSDTLLNNIFSVGIDAEVYGAATEMVELFVDLLADGKETFDLLYQIKSESQTVFDHSVAVCLLSIMVSNKIGFVSAKDQFNLSVASMLHDCGKIKMPDEYFTNPYRHLTPEEQEIIERHPVTGMEMISKIEGINSDVYDIVLHHEEFAETSEWGKLDEFSFLPLAHIVAVSNMFCNLVAANQQPFRQVLETLLQGTVRCQVPFAGHTAPIELNCKLTY